MTPVANAYVQMRVDGALMRLRDTRMFCRIQSGSTAFPVVIRERNIKEDTFEALASVCNFPVNFVDVFMFTCVCFCSELQFFTEDL